MYIDYSNYIIDGKCILPYTITEIGPVAFDGNTELKSIKIPTSVTKIGGEAFCGCKQLTSIHIPNSVVEMGDDVFSWCSGLERIEVDNNNQNYCSANNCCLTKDGKKLVFGCKSSIIPKGVTEIGRNSFRGCTGLTSLEIPESVTMIGDFAFEGCTGLTSIKIPDSVTKIGEGAFYGCKQLTTIEISDSITEFGSSAFDGSSELQLVFINANNSNPEECEWIIYSSLYLIFGDKVKLVVYVPEGTDNEFRNYPGFYQDRLVFIPRNFKALADCIYTKLISEKEAHNNILTDDLTLPD